METDTQNPSGNVNETAVGAEHNMPMPDTSDINSPLHPEHPEHHKHMSALRAAHVSHSAVGHVMPHHKGIEL